MVTISHLSILNGQLIIAIYFKKFEIFQKKNFKKNLKRLNYQFTQLLPSPKFEFKFQNFLYFFLKFIQPKG